MLKNFSLIRRVYGFNDSELTDINTYLIGLVHGFLLLKTDFCARDLLGGRNAIWRHTPLQILYSRLLASGKSKIEAKKIAGQQAGWLLKAALHSDPKNIYIQIRGYTARYELLKRV